jgi:hypothetical protein
MSTTNGGDPLNDARRRFIFAHLLEGHHHKPGGDRSFRQLVRPQ